MFCKKIVTSLNPWSPAPRGACYDVPAVVVVALWVASIAVEFLVRAQIVAT